MKHRLARIAALLLLDAGLIHICVWASLAIRLDGQVPETYWLAYRKVALWIIAGILAVAGMLKLHVGLWRYASVSELLRIAVTGLAAGGIVGLATVVIPDPPLFPRSVPIIFSLLFTAVLGFSRLSLRALRQWRHVRLRERQNGGGGRSIRVLIVGAGDAGVMVLEELNKTERRPVGFVDDELGKQGLTIRGVRVLGTTEDVPRLVRQLGVDEVLLAMPSAPPQRIRTLVENWRKLPARLTTVPRIHDLIDGKVTVNQIRPVAVEDLLGRPPVRLDTGAVKGLIRARRVLVTGAGGSIGAELCRQIVKFEPAELVMVGHGENSLFETEQMLKELGTDVPLHLVVADVRDRVKIGQVFERFRPQLVFHAAAHKHVPFMEMYPEEACKTNIFGTQNVAEAAIAWGCERFVMISTDKAVNPTSVMGATKRVAEMLVQQLNGLGMTKFVSVRFGNVLGSRGSVVPLFQRQIARGGPVTVTHPDMVRYFMTIPEAAQLVLQAAAMGKGGEVFVLDMGKPVKIVDLAHQLITLSGYEPQRDIPIVFTGMRPGEKLYEELLTAEEGTDATHHERVYIARGQATDPEHFQRLLRELEQAVFPGVPWHRDGRIHVLTAAHPSGNGTEKARFRRGSVRADGKAPSVLSDHHRTGKDELQTAREETAAGRADSPWRDGGERIDPERIVCLLTRLVPTYQPSSRNERRLRYEGGR